MTEWLFTKEYPKDKAKRLRDITNAKLELLSESFSVARSNAIYYLATYHMPIAHFKTNVANKDGRDQIKYSVEELLSSHFISTTVIGLEVEIVNEVLTYAYKDIEENSSMNDVIEVVKSTLQLYKIDVDDFENNMLLRYTLMLTQDTLFYSEELLKFYKDINNEHTTFPNNLIGRLLIPAIDELVADKVITFVEDTREGIDVSNTYKESFYLLIVNSYLSDNTAITIKVKE